MKKINLLREFLTSYEDGSRWLEYTIDGRYAYEVLEKSDELTKEDLELRALEKIDINNCSSNLKRYILECLESENEMFFLEFEDAAADAAEMKKDTEIYLQELYNEVVNLRINEYVEFTEDDAALILYGGIITRFIF